MGQQYPLNSVRAEVVRILEEGMLLDSACHLHYYDSKQADALTPGFYIVLRPLADGLSKRYSTTCRFVGPFPSKTTAEMLYASATHMGSAALPEPMPIKSAAVRPAPWQHRKIKNPLRPAVAGTIGVS